ncbi:hypothetical protein ACFL0V_04150 [Nanoarchaeota archaeon]
MAFVVVISAFMYNFMKTYTEDTTHDVKKQVYNTDECRPVGINIQDGCVSAQVLNITLQNTNYVRIQGMDFRFYGLNNRPVGNNRTSIVMNPNRIKEVSIDTGVTGVAMVEVVPVVYKENIEIICSDKKAQLKVNSC